MTTSLYRCPGCGRTVRYGTGARLGCLCDALPLGKDPEWPHPFGPRRPYFSDREHRMSEMPDDGRSDVEDLRDDVWMA